MYPNVLQFKAHALTCKRCRASSSSRASEKKKRNVIQAIIELQRTQKTGHPDLISVSKI